MAKHSTTPPDLLTQAGRLRWARERAGYSSARAAAIERGWNENTYKSHEQGIRQAEGLKTATAEKYARAFRVSHAWLMTGTGDPLKPDLPTEQLELAKRFLEAMQPSKVKAPS